MKKPSPVNSTDVLIFFGLALLAGGLAMVSIPLSICVTGGLILAMGLVGAWRKGAK